MEKINKIKIGENLYPINTKLTLGTMYRCKKCGALREDFVSNIIKFGVMAGNSDTQEMDFINNVNDDDIVGAVYASYMNANSNCIAFDEFIEQAEFNFVLMFQIYVEVINNIVAQNVDDTFSKEFKRVTPSNKNRNKKKFQK